MAVVLRLSRAGAKKAPYYHIVAADSRNSRDGRFLEAVGSFEPKESKLSFDDEKLGKWLERGAVPSDTVRSLIKRHKKTSAAASEQAPEQESAPTTPAS